MQNEKIDVKRVLESMTANYRMDLMPEENMEWLNCAFDSEKTWEDNLKEREDKEVDFSRMYASDFAHGTNGHNQYMLIAKLSAMLDVYETALDAVIDYVETGRVG